VLRLGQTLPQQTEYHLGTPSDLQTRAGSDRLEPNQPPEIATNSLRPGAEYPIDDAARENNRGKRILGSDAVGIYNPQDAYEHRGGASKDRT